MSALIKKTVAILESFSIEQPDWALGALSRRLSMPKSTVHHILAAFKKERWITQDPVTKRYRLSIKLWELGWVALHPLHLREEAMPHVETLAKKTNETVHLSVIDTTFPEFVTYIDKIESDHPVRTYSMIGGRAPSYCVASGKAILAFNPDLLAPLVKRKLKAYSPKSITSPKKLKQEMQCIRERGYSTNREEYRADVIGVGAPIYDHEGRVLAAVGISGPAYRLDDKTIERVFPVVIRTANHISKAMGYFEKPSTSKSSLKTKRGPKQPVRRVVRL